MSNQLIRDHIETEVESPLVQKYGYLYNGDDTPSQSLRDAFSHMKAEMREKLIRVARVVSEPSGQQK